jgi:hypothetical protein
VFNKSYIPQNFYKLARRFNSTKSSRHDGFFVAASLTEKTSQEHEIHFTENLGRSPVLLGRLYILSFTITALGLLDSVYFCAALSMGQLPFQVFRPVRITVLLRSALAVALAIEPSLSGVKLAESQGDTLRER